MISIAIVKSEKQYARHKNSNISNVAMICGENTQNSFHQQSKVMQVM
jgi:hypothetical protein